MLSTAEEKRMKTFRENYSRANIKQQYYKETLLEIEKLAKKNADGLDKKVIKLCSEVEKRIEADLEPQK